jgi:uncharacterized protein (TIGR00730 family)
MNFEDKEISFPFATIYSTMAIQSLAVFCGSKNGNNTLFIKHATELGQLMAANNVRLIYGGGRAGIMGAIADSVMDNGGKVTGIIPKILIEWEVQHHGITEMIVTDDMHERKKILYERCDAALVLPGGFGTLDELFEIITWNQLSIHDKHIYILNSGGFYNYLAQHIELMKQESFLYEEAVKRITIIDDPAALVPYFNSNNQ